MGCTAREMVESEVHVRFGEVELQGAEDCTAHEIVESEVRVRFGEDEMEGAKGSMTLNRLTIRSNACGVITCADMSHVTCS